MALENNIISIVHAMAYPGPGSTNTVSRGEADENYLLTSIKKIIDDPYFGAIEVTYIKNDAVVKKVAEIFKNSSKKVIFSAQPVQLSHTEDMVEKTDISSIDEKQRQIAVERMFRLIDQAYDIGAESIAFVSGVDTPDEKLRPMAKNSLVMSIDQMCNYSDVEGKKLNRRPLNFILELFDRENKKGFKDQLVGPSSEAIKIAREVRHVFGHRNFGLMYDLSHMLLIKDNDGKSETPGVLKALAPYLFHIHIGNCVIDKNDPYYGDSHVSMDYRNGAVSKNILKEFVKALVEIGYKGIIGFEVATVKGEVSESVINIHKAYFDDARNSVIVNYALGSYAYVNRKFMPEQLFDMITDIRVAKPYAIYDEAKARRKRENLTLDGKLLILACDHPARCVTSVGDDPIKMGSRFEYLGRILRVLCHEEVDGVMTTPDIMDELFIISGIFREKTGKSFIDDKVLVGCMNRSGLAGFRYEMDDRMTAYDAETIVNMRMDAAKILLRLDKYRHSKESIMTMDYCAKAIDDCNKYDIPVMIEPLPVEHTEDGYKTKMDKDSLIQTIGVASALGNSSRNHWIKIPYVEGYSDVVKSTTMPILMLGGASEGSPVNTLENFERGMGAGRNVRGALVGRNVLYPGNDDPQSVAVAISRIVHKNYSAQEAVKFIRCNRDNNINLLRDIL